MHRDIDDRNYCNCDLPVRCPKRPVYDIYRLRKAKCRLFNFILYLQVFLFPLSRANRKQANLSAIQAKLTDIQANQKMFSMQSTNAIHHQKTELSTVVNISVE